MELQQSKIQNQVRYSLLFSSKQTDEAKNAINNTYVEPKFKNLLFKYIDRTDMKDSEVYKKVFIDRRVFSEIKK